MSRQLFASVVARAMLAGPRDIGSIVERVRLAVGRRGLPAISRRYLEAFAGRLHPRRRDVIQFLLQDSGFQRLRLGPGAGLGPIPGDWPWPAMNPAPAAARWPIPAIVSIGDLCQWLRVTPNELAWLVDLKQITGRTDADRLHHYVYSAVRKRSGAIRLIESPKQHLKLLQRQILRDVLDHVPSHPAAHGFVRGRSIRSFAAPHTGQRVVLRMDIQDFFPSIPMARVSAFFRTAGYPEAVADMLAGLCCNAVALFRLKQLNSDCSGSELADLRQLYAHPHLPQGAPTSPAVANACAYRLDCRLDGLASKCGATYTRYADDLAFSGSESFERGLNGFIPRVGAILLEEGFSVNHRKTRIQRRSARQQLAGLVVNRHLNVPRKDFDSLKAILTNCIRYGPESQNRDGVLDFRAHLLGKVAFVESIHPGRGARLRGLFNRIRW